MAKKKPGNNMDALYKGKSSGQPDKLTNWKNEPKFSDLEADRTNSLHFQTTNRENLLKYEEIRNGGKEIEKVKPGKSTTRPKLVRKQNEYKYAALEDAILGTQDLFDIKGVGPEDNKSAEQNQILLNYQFRYKIKIDKLVEEIVRTNVDEGSVICKVGWKTEYGTGIEQQEKPVYASAEESYEMMSQMVQNGEMTPEQMQAMIETGEPMQIGTEIVDVEVEKLIVNHPTIEVRNSANIIIDTTCEGDIEKAQFLIEEYPISFAELKKQEYKEETIEIETVGPDGNTTIVKETKTRGIYKNLEFIDENKEEYQYSEYHGESARNSKMTGKSRIKLKAYDYWGFWDIHGDGNTVPIVATWVGGVLVRLEENPFGHKKIPYVIAKYMPVKREVMGEPDAVLLEENQEAVGKTTRAIQDIMSLDAVNQEFIDETFFPSPVERENYRLGKTVFFRSGMDPKKAIFKNNVNPVNNIALQWINAQIQDAEAMSGTTLNNNSTNGISVNAQRRIDSSNSKRDASVLRRITSMLVDAARLIIAMNAEFLSEEEIVRNTNKEYVKISRDDLTGSHDITIDIQTPETNNAIAQDLSMVLQTGQQTMSPELSKKIWARILKLKGQYDLAREFEAYQPQPDPKQQELLDMQIEEQRLKIEKAKKDIEEVDSRIHERISRVVENEKDVENKQSQNLLRQQQRAESAARTRKIEEEADILAQNFVDLTTGAKRARELEDKAMDFDTRRKEKLDDADIEMTKQEMMLRIKQLEAQLSGTSNNKGE